jgi:cytochrome c oxidase assembly factor CtaG
LFLALESPIHELGERLFWVHMTQHEILMLVCAPLLVLGQPLVVLLSALPRSIRNLCARILHARIVRAAGNLISRPLVAWCLSAAALWVWHAPSLFDATLHSDWIHALQHLSFLLTAILFWWSLLESRRRAVDYGASILFVFTTAVHTSLLGVLLTFSSKPWYPSYALTAPKLGYSPLEDQQIGGLIMWVPAGVLLTVIALLMVPAWLRSSDKRYALWCEPASPSNTVSRS